MAPWLSQALRRSARKLPAGCNDTLPRPAPVQQARRRCLSLIISAACG
ncbi:MAG: hypothetical protein MZV63_62270 [Marinilabiliales bacterium]|nr:hypothetical protein [Marinilabiliales bacterium]